MRLRLPDVNVGLPIVPVVNDHVPVLNFNFVFSTKLFTNETSIIGLATIIEIGFLKPSTFRVNGVV